jgi:aspartate carbamoyltransferase regulatory subunit
MKEKTLSVSAIKEGTVIDHIKAGQALKIVRLLRFAENERRVTVGLNLRSATKGLKDIIKIENVFLTPSQAAHIAVFSPNATVNVIENYQVAKKFKVEMPEAIAAILCCPNGRCVTRAEAIPTLFIVDENNSHVILRCHYCEKCFSRDEMREKYTQET